MIVSSTDRQKHVVLKIGSMVGFIAAFCVPLALYVRTLAPTVYNLDSAELTTAAYTGGLIRATGYPLYLLLGRLWSRVVLIGDVSCRMNLLSAVFGALTVALVFVILKRLGVGLWMMRAKTYAAPRTSAARGASARPVPGKTSCRRRSRSPNRIT